MVYVLSKEGKPLMPTERHGKVRHLLEKGKARVVRRTPFTIQLLYETENRTQPVTLGVDAGSRHVGLSATTESKELFAGELTPRNDVTKLLEARRNYRRSRRGRNRRHHAARFNNRVHAKQKGWLAPSVEVKIHNHIQGIREVTKLLPVTKIVVETAEFDLQALKAEARGENKPVGKEYHQGEMYGFYNARQYVLWRDGYKCRCCGATKGKLFVVNSEGIETGSPEDKHTVCEACFKSGSFSFTKKRYWAHPTFMGIMRRTLLKRLKDGFPGVAVEETTGAITKMAREVAHLEKSHVTDAFCISGNTHAKRIKDTYRLKPVRRHNRQTHKAAQKGGIRKRNQTPKYVQGFQLFDQVQMHDGRESFLFGRRASGYFDVRTLDGKKLSPNISYKKLKPLKKRSTVLIERCAI